MKIFLVKKIQFVYFAWGFFGNCFFFEISFNKNSKTLIAWTFLICCVNTSLLLEFFVFLFFFSIFWLENRFCFVWLLLFIYLLFFVFLSPWLHAFLHAFLYFDYICLRPRRRFTNAVHVSTFFCQLFHVLPAKMRFVVSHTTCVSGWLASFCIYLQVAWTFDFSFHFHSQKCTTPAAATAQPSENMLLFHLNARCLQCPASVRSVIVDVYGFQ